MKKKHLSTRTLLSLLGLMLTFGSVNSQSIVASLEKTFTGITNIEIEGYYCNVEVSGSSSASEVHFKGELFSSVHYYLNIHESVNGNTLKIWVDRPKSNPGNTRGVLTLTVPSRTRLNINNTNGKVLIQNMAGDMHQVVTTLGAVTIRNVRSNISLQTVSGGSGINGLTGDLELATRLGEHIIKNVTGNLVLNAQNGNISVSEVKGKVNATTTLGKQSMQRISGNIEMESKEGDLTLNGITGNVIATTESGSLSLNNAVGAFQLSSVVGSQSGKGNRLTGDSSFTSMSGSINMQLLNAKQQLSFYLTATSGVLKAKGSTGRRNLVVDNGGIRVTGKSGAGNQTYY